MKRPIPWHHHCLSQAVIQRGIREDFALWGFTILHVLSDGQEPDFSYTIGLARSHMSRPELIISGLRVETRMEWLQDLSLRIQGPPSRKQQRSIAWKTGISPHMQHYPAGGQIFQPGMRYEDLASSGLPTCFGDVEDCQYEAHFGQAIVYHGHAHFPVLQLVWPDTQGLFPWEAPYEQRFQGKQRLLFDPHPYLPSKARKNCKKRKRRKGEKQDVFRAQ